MKRNNKKALYESIMSSVAREVKKALNESSIEDYNIEYSNLIPNKVKKYCREHNISYNIIDVIHKKYVVKQKRSEGWHLWYNIMGEATGNVLEVEFIGDNIKNNVLYFNYWENEDMDNKLYVSILPIKPTNLKATGSIVTKFFRVFESKMIINDLEYFLYDYDGNDWHISDHFRFH